MDGKGNTKVGVTQKIPDLTSAKWQEGITDAAIKEVINNGPEKKDSKMKGYKDKFTQAEIDSLVKYIR
jgi:hypothetical protein